MGLLPSITQDLFPDAYSSSREAALAHSGWLVGAYALGVVIGAPTVAIGIAKLRQKTALLTLVAAFVIGSLASAVLPSFEGIVLARFLTGLPHGAYFGVAALVAAQLLGPGRRGLAAATVIGGLTVANVIGIPLITWLGLLVGWRSAYLVIAGIFLVTLVSIALVLPSIETDSKAVSIRAEIGVLRRGQVWLALGIGSIGFSSLFAMYAYLAPLAEHYTKLAPEALPWVLASTGVGMTIGNFGGGWAADRNVRLSTYASFAVMLTGLLILTSYSSNPIGLILGVTVVGMGASALGPTLQTRLMDVGKEGPTLAAALNHSAFNVGNALGAVIGGMVISVGLGYLAPIWTGIIFSAAGLAIACVSFALDGRWVSKFRETTDTAADTTHYAEKPLVRH